MRIEGYIEHPIMKITIFKMDNKYSVKFETQLYEQTFKLREGNLIQDINDVKKWANLAFQEKVLENFSKMHEINMINFSKMDTSLEDQFEEII